MHQHTLVNQLPEAEIATSSGVVSSTSSLAVRNRNKIIRKRANFNPDQRQKVNAVRKRGACLRCRLMKITCSEDDLCTTCERAARICYSHEKGPIAFVGCIRTTLAQVSVFEHVFSSTSFPNNSSWNFPVSSGRRASGGMQTGTTNATQDVSIMSGLMIHTMQLWMGSSKAPKMKAAAMIVPDTTAMRAMRGVLDFEITTLLDLPAVKEMRQCFATMFVLAAYPNSNRELFSMAGHQCLKWLDRKLKPYFLGSCSSQDLQALMLLVFGTIFSVASATPAVEHPLFPTDEEQGGTNSNMTLFDALQEHLCRMLVYYISFLASRIGFERPASFAGLMTQVETRSHGWRENAALFAAAGLEKTRCQIIPATACGVEKWFESGAVEFASMRRIIWKANYCNDYLIPNNNSGHYASYTRSLRPGDAARSSLNPGSIESKS